MVYSFVLPMRSFAAFALALAACEPALPTPASAPPAPLPAPPPPPAFAPATEGTFASSRYHLRVPLPEGRAWRIDDHTTPWLSATHAATASTLLVRTWNEEGRATRARCEERARMWQKLPDREPKPGVEVLQDRAIDAPAGFDTRLFVALVAQRQGAPINAYAAALGAHAHRCFVWIYTTSASGPGAERVLGERLAAMIEASLAKIAIDSELTPRIPREPIGPSR